MADSINNVPGQGRIFGSVSHSDAEGHTLGPISTAEVLLYKADYYPQTGAESKSSEPLARTSTDATGNFRFPGKYEDDTYLVSCTAFGDHAGTARIVMAGSAAPAAELNLQLGFIVSSLSYNTSSGQSDQLVPASRTVVGRRLVLRAEWGSGVKIGSVRWTAPPDASVIEMDQHDVEIVFGRSGKTIVLAGGLDENRNSFGRAEARNSIEIFVSEAEAQTIRGNVGIAMQRTATNPTLDQALWVAIRNRTDAIGFTRYRSFINRVLRWEDNDRLPGPIERRVKDLGTHLHGVGAYQVLKTATEIFLLLECGVRIENRTRDIDEFEEEEQARLGQPVSAAQIAARLSQYLGHPPQLPYITRVVEAAFPEFERAASARDRVLLAARIDEPCLLELIWSYWHEEGMLMQTMNAISQRFQNIRRPVDRDPLLNMEIDPLRPVNNLLWGFVQDEVNRLSVARRAYEYMHQYGLSLYGKATGGIQPADMRSKFLEAFHNLLHQCSIFFKEDFQTTVIADGFPLLNSLKEVHLILAQGAHNQFGDLPWTARAEMLVSEYILSRSEIRDFLQSRVMVPYREPWMLQVDMMKTMQGWTDVTVTHFRDLGVFGEQLLLTIRYGDWIDVNDENSAKNWARYWRSEIQGYLHAYRAATGIDLANPDSVDATIPAVLLQQRLAMQRMR